jgi:AraC family transcriptional regulator of adaptative response/methylated-DNA-[protein]-cysteine methyltransferase
VERVKAGLREGKTVRSAVHNAGYGSTSWIYSGASKLGMTPSAYKLYGKSMKITYRVVESRLGRVLVARTPRGVCYLGLADTDGELEAALRREYPAAELTREYGKPDKWTREVLEYLEGRLVRLDDIPVEVKGTSFQAGVWSLLRSIPRGSTRTYEDVARSMGSPAAARAVGRACATNPVSLLIPCHRVVGKSGAIAGYAWGTERKKALLKTEGINSTTNNSFLGHTYPSRGTNETALFVDKDGTTKPKHSEIRGGNLIQITQNKGT